MGRTGLAAGIAALTFGTQASAADLPPETVPQLVQKLGSPNFREREQASRDLMTIGPDALSSVRALVDRVEDPEARQRLNTIAAKLELNRLTAPTRVTLSLKNATAKAALTEIGKQSGYKFLLNDVGDKSKSITLDLRNVPFWEAVDTVCNAAGITPNPQDENGTLGVYYSNTYNPFAAYSGPIKIVATNINASQNLQLSSIPRHQPVPQSNDYLNLNLQLFAEPKAPLVGVGQVVPTRVEDEDGNSLLLRPDADSYRTSYYPPTASYRSYNLSTSATLWRSGRTSKRIKLFQAKVPVLILTETRPEATVTNLLKDKTHKAAGKTFDLTLTDVVDRNPGIALTATFARKGGDPNDYSWTNTLTQRIAVLDEKGNTFSINNIEYESQGPANSTIKFEFTPQGGNGKVGKPDRLIVYEWLTQQTELSFELRDIPLP